VLQSLRRNRSGLLGLTLTGRIGRGICSSHSKISYTKAVKTGLGWYLRDDT
jgi:hypothetical protein